MNRLHAALLLALAPACLTPPVMMQAPAANFVKALEFFPPGSEPRELRTKDGATLRGVFVPAGEGAPVVLHLLGAAQSPSSLAQPLDTVAWRLADEGFASLFVDYRGVGASDGERDARKLGADAWAMWNEALRLAGGDPARVAVRATSLGAIATGLLLQRGARPGAILLVAPVFPDTVVERFARDTYGIVAGWFAALAYRSVADVDVAAELERSGAPVCATVFENDTWASAKQLNRLFEAVASSSPHSWRRKGGDHVGGVVFTTSLTEDECRFLSGIRTLHSRAPRSASEAHEELSAHAREALTDSDSARQLFDRLAARFGLAPADHLAAAALEQSELNLAERWIDTLRHVPRQGAPFDELRALYAHDGDDPEALAIAIQGLAFFGGDLVRRGLARDQTGWDTPAGVEANVRALRRDRAELRRQLRGRTTPGTLTATWTPTPLLEKTSSDVELRRVLARAALKLAGHRERLVSDEEGLARLEYLDQDTWRELVCDDPLASASGVAP